MGEEEWSSILQPDREHHERIHGQCEQQGSQREERVKNPLADSARTGYSNRPNRPGKRWRRLEIRPRDSARRRTCGRIIPEGGGSQDACSALDGAPRAYPCRPGKPDRRVNLHVAPGPDLWCYFTNAGHDGVRTLPELDQILNKPVKIPRTAPIVCPP